MERWTINHRPPGCLREQRYEKVQLAGNHWSAVVTYRGDKIRIISVRRARSEEVAIYEG